MLREWRRLLGHRHQQSKCKRLVAGVYTMNLTVKLAVHVLMASFYWATSACVIYEVLRTILS